jgi:hypothetical protein
MRGHNKKIPKVIKELKGTVRKDRDSNQEILPAAIDKLPPAPKDLKAEGLTYYNEQGNKLLEFGLINEYNLPTFMTICFMITNVSKASRKLNMAKSQSDISACARVYLEFQKNLRLSMSEFGLTPASVSKIKLPKKEEKKPFTEFMNDK